MNTLKFDRTNLICGLIFVGLGIFFALQSLDLELGTAFRMGPGYFPFILALALILFGGIILVQSLRVVHEPISGIAWRGMFFILAAPILFGITVRGLGFGPSLFICSFVACFASTRMKPLAAIALSVAVTVFSILVFTYGLGLPFRVLGPWLGY